jgi:phospholipase C
MVADHMRDVTDLFTDLANGTLPAVSYVKPDGYLDGHPGGGKMTLFEAFVKNLIERAWPGSATCGPPDLSHLWW